MSTILAPPPTVIRVDGETYLSASDVLAIARKSKLAVSTVVRVLQAVAR
jgi:hypothetical protein